MNTDITKRAAQVKRYFKKDRLAISNKFNMDCALYKKSDEGKPFVSVKLDGDYKVDIIKFCLIVAGVMLAVVGFSMTMKGIFKKKK